MTPADPRGRGITGPMTGLYDVFVDWPGRLGRELPGLIEHLERAGAQRVLDLGCGTGRHVRALRERGYDAHGADVSEPMLAVAGEHVGMPGVLHRWRMGDAAPESLREAVAANGPFDAAYALGNVWPQLLTEADVDATLASLRELVRPGGILVLGLKAVAVRREKGDPYLPLLRREHEGRVLWFVRFVSFTVPPGADGAPLCEFHMSVLEGTSDDPDACTALVHRASRVRVWSAGSLAERLRDAGLADVRVSGRLDDPGAPAQGEDVFASARFP